MLRYTNNVAGKACHVVGSATQVGLTQALGRMTALIAIVQLLLAPVLLVAALGVRLAGSSKPLNVVDYERVEDRAALHRWAGNRLLLLPAVALTSGIVSLQAPGLSAVAFGLTVLAILVVGAWVASGAEKFQSAA